MNMNRKNDTLKKTVQIAHIFQNAFEQKNVQLVKNTLKKIRINVVNEVIEEMEDTEAIIFVLMIIDDKQLGPVFKNIHLNTQTKILENSNTTQLKKILKFLYPDEIVDIIKENDENIKKKIILSLDATTRSQIKEISDYEEEEAGSIMNPEFISFLNEMTISECLQLMKKHHDSVETNTTFYITSKNNLLLGKVTIQDLIFSSDYNKHVSSIMDENLIVVNSNDDVEKIIEIFQDYFLDYLPVVDNDNKLIGIIDYKDILPALEEEATEDIYNMYGITELKENYITAGIWKIVKSRLFWIVILMISATLTSIVIDRFNAWGDSITAGVSTLLLVPIIPVITGTSGNAGSQSIATVVRALSIGEFSRKEYGKVILKEFYVGLCLGSILMLINFVRLSIYFAIPEFRSLPPGVTTTIKNTYVISLIPNAASSVALFIAIVLSKTLGASLPLLANKFNLDPTVMSAPLISTILDVCSTSILFSIGIGVLLPIIA